MSEWWNTQEAHATRRVSGLVISKDDHDKPPILSKTKDPRPITGQSTGTKHRLTQHTSHNKHAFLLLLHRPTHTDHIDSQGCIAVIRRD